jgi:hypothetical protein
VTNNRKKIDKEERKTKNKKRVERDRHTGKIAIGELGHTARHALTFNRKFLLLADGLHFRLAQRRDARVLVVKILGKWDEILT